MAFQKNFVVKNGIEVNDNLIFANTDSNKVGIATTSARHTLHVNGGIGATSLTVIGVSTFNNLTINGRITAGSSLGAAGQYLVSTGTGVTWGAVPTVRSSDLQTATVGATSFSTTYTVGLIDVYVNGVKLSSNEYTANDGATVVLNDACFGGETVEFISYSPFGIGVGGTSIQGITILEEGSPVGSALQVTSINFVGAAVTATGTGIGVTVYVNDSVNPNYWVSTDVGIHTLSSVGVGTTNPTSALTVKGNTSLETLNVSGVSTFGGYVSVAGTASFTTGVAKGVEFVNENGNGTIRISNDGGNSQGRIGFNGSVESTLYSNYTNGDINFVVGNNFSLDLGSYGTYALYATKNGSVSLYNNGSKKLETLGTGVTVTGTTFTNELSVSGVSTFSGNVRVGVDTSSGVILTSPNSTQYRLIVADDGTLSTVAV